MELSKLIFIVVLIIIVLIFILFPDARALLKAFGHLFVKDMATTPSGAEAIYNAKLTRLKMHITKLTMHIKELLESLVMQKKIWQTQKQNFLKSSLSVKHL